MWEVGEVVRGKGEERDEEIKRKGPSPPLTIDSH